VGHQSSCGKVYQGYGNDKQNLGKVVEIIDENEEVKSDRKHEEFEEANSEEFKSFLEKKKLTFDELDLKKLKN